MVNVFADVSCLAGRSFVASSNLVCKFTLLGEGQLEAFWSGRPTEKDIAEADGWVKSILISEAGPNDLVDLESHRDLSPEDLATSTQAWRDKCKN